MRAVELGVSALKAQGNLAGNTRRGLRKGRLEGSTCRWTMDKAPRGDGRWTSLTTVLEDRAGKTTAMSRSEEARTDQSILNDFPSSLWDGREWKCTLECYEEGRWGQADAGVTGTQQ